MPLIMQLMHFIDLCVITVQKEKSNIKVQNKNVPCAIIDLKTATDCMD